ncbi:MAG: hypothetical protein M1389_12630, partial [Chloroflexi bacterium]|nr:hypothetical protein [Chloroflexota bacterium]
SSCQRVSTSADHTATTSDAIIGDILAYVSLSVPLARNLDAHPAFAGGNHGRGGTIEEAVASVLLTPYAEPGINDSGFRVFWAFPPPAERAGRP